MNNMSTDDSEFVLVAKEWTVDWLGKQYMAYVYFRCEGEDKDYEVGIVHSQGDPELAVFFPKKNVELDLTEMESLVKYMRTGEADIKENR